MENSKYVATALNNIAALNLSGAIDKGQWEKVGLLSRYDHSSVILFFVLVWSGRELGWAVYVCFSMLVFVFGIVWFSIRGRCR